MERYSLDLLITHPDISPDVITEALGLRPHYFWRRGERRRAPDGTERGGIRSDTMWRHVTERRGRRRFFVGLREFLSRLQPKHDFLAGLTSQGGRMTLIVSLPGNVNMGDVLEPQSLQLMSQLGLELGVEVFPRMK